MALRDPELVGEQLAGILSGASLPSDAVGRKRFTSALRDLLPGDELEGRLLARAVELGITDQLLGLPQGTVDADVIAKLAVKWAATDGTTAKHATWAVAVWAAASKRRVAVVLKATDRGMAQGDRERISRHEGSQSLKSSKAHLDPSAASTDSLETGRSSPEPHKGAWRIALLSAAIVTVVGSVASVLLWPEGGGVSHSPIEKESAGESRSTAADPSIGMDSTSSMASDSTNSMVDDSMAVSR